MGCTSYDPLNYEENQKEDYLTKTIFESIMARKRAKIQGEFDAERKEQEDREKELLRQQYLLDSINPRGPKSYVDNLINKEIPKMEFGNLASEEQILDDLNNRECEAYDADEKVEETEEQMTEGEIKEKQEKNRNEMEEIKRKLEELNKKSEEEKGKKSKKKKGEKDGFFGNKKENKEENKSKSKTENEEEKENEENEQSKKEKSELNEEEENENESKIKNNKNNKNIKDKENKKNKNIEEINDNINENEEIEDNEEEDEENINNKRNKNKTNKNKKNEINSKNSQTQHEMETEEEKELSNFKSEDLESDEKEKEKERQLLKQKMQEERKLNRQKKMKELMKLKAENLPYADKIKKYKYPKKEIQEKPEIDFSPTPTEIILCVIGEEKNGKSSFIKKYTRNVFEQTYKKTEEIDTYDNIEVEYENKKIKLNIIDTPPLNKRKYTNLIQENINKSHIIFYVIDINDEYADFKVKLTMQNFEFNEKQIIVILGNKSDKVSIFAKKNKDTFEGYCSLRKYIFEIISCQDKPKNELENFMNNKIIKEYFYLYGK